MALGMRLTTYLLLAFVFLGGSEISTRSILNKKSLKEFYATGGKKYIGKRIHIHLPATILKKKAKRVRLRGGKAALQFENKSVPLLVNPRNIYFKRLMRKKKVDGLLCIKGYVYRPDWDLKGRSFLRVHSIKTYGGKLTYD